MKSTIQKHAVFLATICICCFTACEEQTTVTPSLELDREQIVIEGDTAAVTTFNVYSNVAWKVYSNNYWIEVSPESGTGNATVTLTIAENNDGDERSGEVEIIAGPLREKITVAQAQTVNITTSKDVLELEDYLAGSVSMKVNVKANVDWTAEPSESWIKIAPVKGKAGVLVAMTVSAAYNNTDNVREAKLCIKAGSRTKDITVKQKKSTANSFFGSSETIHLSDKGKYRHFRLWTSFDWTVDDANTSDWIAVDKTNGAGSTLLKVSADSENNTATDRTGKLVFTASGNRKLEIAVVQGHNGNYWNDGDVKVINSHTKGKGVPVVIVGDGFDREDLKKGGWWEDWSTHLAENFIRNEVICDMLDYLDILILMSESQEHGVNYPINDYTPTKTKYGAHGATENQAAVEAAAKAAVKRWGGNDHSDAEIMSTGGNWGADGNGLVRIMFVANGPYPGNATNPMCRMGVDEPDYDYWTIHEFTGHTLCDIPDMYWSGCGLNSPQNVLDLMANVRTKHHVRGYSWFIDNTDDPTQAIWKDFYNQPGYTSSEPHELDRVGAWRTTWGGDFCEGLWGPSRTSCMRDHRLDFDLGSRIQIFNTIHWRAGDPEGKYNNIAAFKEFDRNRTRGFSYKGAYQGAAKKRSWTGYNQRTGQKTVDGDYDRFWQLLWPAY